MAAILFKWVLVSWLSWMHPFYVGVTEVQHNQPEKTLEISIKLFIDDFERGLTDQYKTAVDLSNPKDPKQTETWVFQYIQNNFKLKVDGKPVQLEFVGYEKEREAAWCYVQVKGIGFVQKMELTNTLLYNVLNQQIHLIHLNANNLRKSGKIMFPERQFSASF
ncbi:DUF6702 family protein [Flavihumibacter sp. UBA7668]|uniref:DUF6702 family protein n=1 Tax=Flavihumibacter sp. UBA7668 TaxID=1946542 RepID=UPI0025BA5A38|nr:DUF6702 family protein [Flavihumibacter sp. UBA7668]